MTNKYLKQVIRLQIKIQNYLSTIKEKLLNLVQDESGDVPGWVLVVLMTTGLVTAIWTIAQPRISSILRNSLDSMNNIR
ncbi:MAG: hypothetical protein RL129_333 [Actinomycetota bacterium]|jgi:uncharacterized membrane protein YqjE